MTGFPIYFLILVGSTYLIRALPFSLVKTTITNRFLKSFLYYIPFAVLAAMTLPGALFATGSIYSAIVGILVAVVVSLISRSLMLSATFSCLSALICELLFTFVIGG